MATVLITGGTGLVGTAITAQLTAKDYDVIILSRQPKAAQGKVSYAAWDPQQGNIDLTAFQQADYIINLAGAGIADKRWSKKRKAEIVDSRVKSGETLVQTLRNHPNKVKAVITASGIGWYGDDAGRPANKKTFTEEDPADDEFLGTTCKHWEQSIEPVRELGKRLVIYRIGIALSPAGGAYPTFRKPVQLGFATILGSGNQVMSWIHLEDLARLFVHGIENEQLIGVYNAVAPQPVTHRNFMMALAEKIKGRFCITFYVPSFLLKLAVGGVSVEVLKSATVGNSKVSHSGFQFIFPTLQAALENLERKQV